MEDVCFWMVTCNKEPGRFSLLRSVTETLKSDPDWPNWEDDFFVFDNASDFEGSRSFLEENYKQTFWSQKNYGYWSAVNWLCKKSDEMGYKFIYLIESDCVHYDIARVRYAHEYLSQNPDIGMVRMAKFSVDDRHLYDKRNPQPNSNTDDWCVQYNMFSQKNGEFEKTNVKDIFKTNMVAKVGGFHRISHLSTVMKSLAGKRFSEIDFQREFFNICPENALLDGGLCDSSLSAKMRECAGSYLEENNPLGYIPTRTGNITPYEEVETR